MALSIDNLNIPQLVNALSQQYSETGNWAAWMDAITKTDPIVVPPNGATPNSKNPFIADLEQNPELLAWLATRVPISPLRQSVVSPSSGGTLVDNPFGEVPVFSIATMITTDPVSGAKMVTGTISRFFSTAVIPVQAITYYVNSGMLNVAARPTHSVFLPIVTIVNNTDVAGLLEIDPNGTILIYPTATVGWPAANPNPGAGWEQQGFSYYATF